MKLFARVLEQCEDQCLVSCGTWVNSCVIDIVQKCLVLNYSLGISTARNLLLSELGKGCE